MADLSAEEVPQRLRPEFYFDFEAHPFEHAELVATVHDVTEVLGRIHGYAVAWLESTWGKSQSHYEVQHGAAVADGAKIIGDADPSILLEAEGPAALAGIFAPDVLIGPMADAGDLGLHVARGAQVLGGTFDMRGGGIFLGEGSCVEPGAHVAGPAIIGRRTVLRSGTYIRGDAIVGDDVVLRGELKNTVVMDRAELCHPSYVGDSVIGYHGHFGCQAVTANLGLFAGDITVQLPLETGSRRLALRRRKMGIVLGDHSQLGCCAVSDPATFLGPETHVYPLARLASGFYGPEEIIKNKPEARSSQSQTANVNNRRQQAMLLSYG